MMGSDPLSELMERYAKGEQQVFAQLYEMMAPRLYRFCWRLAGGKSDADDLLQDAFLRLHRARGTYMPGANAMHWAFAIARSAHLDRQRHRRRRPEMVAAAEDAASTGWLAAPGADAPDAAVRVHDLLHVVALELERMSEKNRVAYVLLKEEQLSVSEAAAVLGTSGDVVKQRAHRAYEQIQAALGAAGWSGHDDDTTWQATAIRI